MLEMLRDRFSAITDRIAGWLASSGFTANAITFLGLFLSIAAFAYLYLGNSLSAAILILASGLSDALDGAVARKLGQAGVLGSFIDSVVDRVEDGILLLGMGMYSKDLLLAALAIHSALLVSYIRAKAESLRVIGTQYSLTGRAERILLAAIFCAVDHVWIGLLILIILNYATAIERALIFLRRIGIGVGAEKGN